MINTKKKTLLMLLVGVLALAMFASALILPTVVASAEEWNGSTIKSEYSKGTEFTVPNYTVTVGGTTVTASSSLIFPSGTALGKKKVVLDEIGQYSLVYTAKVNGKIYSKKYSFAVNDKFVNYKSDDTSVTYGKWKHAEVKEGLLVRLASGDTLSFSSPIDVTNTTVNDTILDFFVTPDTIDVNDFDRMVITFTDSLDSSVYLKVTVRSGGQTVYPGISFLLAGGNGQPLKGIEHQQGGKVHTANQYGNKIMHSFSGIVENASRAEDNSVQINYDPALCTAYVNRSVIIDLDSPDYYSVLWNGFPSGYVKMSIQCDMYSASTANFCITSVRGLEISESTVTDNFVDADAPMITVDTEYETAPVAKVGLNYAVPSATAIDLISGVCEVKTRVYYNYASVNSAVSVPCENGYFKPDRLGNYAIVYEATDKSGNVAKEVIWVKVVSDVALPVVSFSATGATTSGVLGELITVPSATATATSGNATVVITATNGTTVYDVTNGSFRPEVEGTYTVKATATDYIGQKKDSESYTVTVARGNKPVFVDPNPLPKYFISGYEYTLGEYYANDYTSGKLERKLAYAEITDKNGTYTVQAGETFRPTVNANGETVKVTYKCGNATLENTVTTILAFENDKLQLDNYIIKSGVTTSVDKSGISIIASSSNGGWEFANKLIAKDFAVTIAGKEKTTNYSALRIVLEDSENANCAIEARLVDKDYYLDFIVGSQIVKVSKTFTSGADIQLGFDGRNFVVDTTSVNTLKTISGEPFNGFASNKLYFSIYFEDAVVGTSEYVVNNVSGQPITSVGRDRVVPLISMLGDSGDVCVLGEVKTIPAAIVADVLTPDVKASVSIYDIDGEPMVSVDGLKLENVDPGKEYTIELKQYGRYTVEYQTSDTNEGVTTYYSYVITVEDSYEPVVTFKNSAPSKAKLNDTIAMPDFTVSDNVTAEENLIVMRFVKSPSGEISLLENGSNSVVATKVGTYEFIIMVMDELGNLAVKNIVITVEA